MLLYNGIVRGERFIATISMSPFHGYRFVRGQRCASPLRDASFTGGREREGTSGYGASCINEVAEIRFLPPPLFAERFLASSSPLVVLALHEKYRMDSRQMVSTFFILDFRILPVKKIPKEKEEKRNQRSITFLNKEADSLSNNSGFGKSRWRTNGQIDKSGAGISESRSRWEETIDRGPCFVSYARESRSRYAKKKKKWSGCTCGSVKVHLKRVGRGTDEKLSRKG